MSCRSFRALPWGRLPSNAWAYERRELLMAGRMRAIDRARADYTERHVREMTP